MKVLITPRGFQKAGLHEVERMRKAGLEVHYNDTGIPYTHEEFVSYAKDADAIIVGVDRMDKAMIEQCPHLKVICKFGVGTDNIDLDVCKERNIYVGKTIGSNSRSVAEHVIAMMFTEAKNIYETVRDCKAGKWDKPTGYEITGKQIGIIGFGAIGKHVADMAHGLGMSIKAFDAFTIDTDVAEAYHAEIATFEDILRTCDYISLHIPLTDETANMISTEEFKMMKPNACLVNAARGGIVDEGALYEALHEGVIRSACFDVFSVEPPKHDEKLLALDNFLLTPHTASRTYESETRTCEISTEIVMRELEIL